MGFPIGNSQLVLPKILLHTLTILTLLHNHISSIFSRLCLSDILWHTPPTTLHHHHSISATLLREILPVIKFSDLTNSIHVPETCAVCLYEFEFDSEIQRLTNCRHIFHRECLDRWMDCEQRSCPLCKTCFVFDEMLDDFNERFWVASVTGL